ncbi:DUF2515 family protein [Salirhabdus salicampi]|uniref:DUF2515 family protein n=1 Tax=Salirhabdus salicampi TaxID=476102 RepID=UPI0020C1BAF0|nr:DUF2515 family protein [Salirhabdus salicampi]MCP8616662.1 DUF2515 domain-containing protein [Salirhabdus salicampi]
MSDLIQEIKQKTEENNRTNVTRTKAYLAYYKQFPEIKWSLLASMVSRNAGWNMTDLETDTYKTLLSDKMRRHLFMTYERANWFIFSDAYPQLLIYQYSVERNKPLFDLLPALHVSNFMYKEWLHFWKYENKHRLMKALIINEQNLIHEPIIKQPFFKFHVFWQLPYILQEKVHLNAVLFPTMTKEIYGIFIKDFTNVTKRIETGKTLAFILFHPKYYNQITDFAYSIEPTGSRNEYEQFMVKYDINSPEIHDTFPVIEHANKYHEDWYKNGKHFQPNWWDDSSAPRNTNIKQIFYKKRAFLRMLANMKQRVKKASQ